MYVTSRLQEDDPLTFQYLSCWYKRSEFGIRAAIFFSAAALAGSFGGLLAAGIAQMRGVGGKPGWAWILYVETNISNISKYVY